MGFDDICGYFSDVGWSIGGFLWLLDANVNVAIQVGVL
jgi:hypothetical protein